MWSLAKLVNLCFRGNWAGGTYSSWILRGLHSTVSIDPQQWFWWTLLGQLIYKTLQSKNTDIYFNLSRRYNNIQYYKNLKILMLKVDAWSRLIHTYKHDLIDPSYWLNWWFVLWWEHTFTISLSPSGTCSPAASMRWSQPSACPRTKWD